MPLKRCLSCWRWALPGKSRCADHERARQQAKDAKRPTRRSHAEQQRRRQQVTDYPQCAVCGATENLSAEHFFPVAIAVAQGVPVEEAEAGPLITLCVPCNSRRGATVRRNPP